MLSRLGETQDQTRSQYFGVVCWGRYTSRPDACPGSAEYGGAIPGIFFPSLQDTSVHLYKVPPECQHLFQNGVSCLFLTFTVSLPFLPPGPPLVCQQVMFPYFLINLKSVRKSLTPLPSVTFFKLEPSLVYHLALHPFTSCLSSD